jgi:hypothetical protein
MEIQHHSLLADRKDVAFYELGGQYTNGNFGGYPFSPANLAICSR